MELATDGGPGKVVLREVARRAGVSATAAYRHFGGQGDLLLAVKTRAQRLLADVMERVAATVPGADDPGEAAERRLAAIGRGYIDFALEQPGLFRTAFHHAPSDDDGVEWAGAGPPVEDPQYRSYGLLTRALDDLAATGRMPAPNRPGAEVAAWSVAHGLAMLILDGPMGRLPAADRDAMIERAIDTVVAGLVVPRRGPDGA